MHNDIEISFSNQIHSLLVVYSNYCMNFYLMEKIRDGNIIIIAAKKPLLWGSWNSQYNRKTLLSSSLLYICTDCNLSEVSSSLEKNQVWISTIWLIWLWPSTRTPRPRGQEIYNFCIPFFGHQNYIQCT